MSKLVVGIAGPPGAGKTEVAKVAVRLGFSYLRMGDVVVEEVRRRGLEISEESVGRVASELRKLGEAEVARRCIPSIRQAEGPVVVDGIRSPAEVREFRREFNGFRLISVWSSQATRYQRISKRRREDDAAGWEEFLRKDEREMSWGLGEVIVLSDYLLVNEGTVEELRGEAERCLRRLLAG
ncbi:MAG: AAA family ATPase [Candidatus Hadarchaeales archaeon]